MRPSGAIPTGKDQGSSKKTDRPNGAQAHGTESGRACRSKIAKDSDSAPPVLRGLIGSPGPRAWRETMAERTCAACDYELDANPIKVTIGGKTVEVCCDECALKLKEAHASATAARRG